MKERTVPPWDLTAGPSRRLAEVDGGTGEGCWGDARSFGRGITSVLVTFTPMAAVEQRASLWFGVSEPLSSCFRLLTLFRFHGLRRRIVGVDPPRVMEEGRRPVGGGM